MESTLTTVDAPAPHLSEAHRTMLHEESGLSPETVVQRGYRTVSGQAGAEELGRLGFNVAQARSAARGDVLLVPLYDVTGAEVGHQIRPDAPRVNKSGNPIKYETPAGAANRVDVPPAGRALVADGASPLWITEGAKTADALAQAGAATLMLAGVWGFMGRGEGVVGTAVVADLYAVPVEGRTVYLAYDSDVVTKEGVKAAEKRLSEVLGVRGAVVLAVRIPDGPGGSKQGADDYLARGGTLDALIGTATSPQTAADPLGGSSPQRYAYDLAQEGVELAVDVTGGFLRRPTDATGAVVGPARRYSGKELRTWMISAAGARGVVALPIAAAQHAVERLAGDHLDSRVALASSHIVHTDGAVFLDMGTTVGHDVVRLNADGWGYVPWAQVPAWLVRTAEAKVLDPLTPETVRSWEPLRALLGLDDASFAAVRVWLACVLLLDRVPLLWWRGAAGSGKTLRAQMVGQVLGLPDAPNPPRDIQEAMSRLAASPWLSMDNLGHVGPATSDLWCAAISNGTVSTRPLYADTSVSMASRWTGQVTSIADVGGALDDMMSRALVVDVPMIESRRSAPALSEAMAACAPAVRGALLDDACAVLRLMGAELPHTDYRFPQVIAVARALDSIHGTGNLHESAIEDTGEAAVSERADNDEWVTWLARATRERGGHWVTSATGILDAQRVMRRTAAYGTDDADAWPGSAKQVGMWLPQRAGRLRSMGVAWRKLQRVAGPRPYALTVIRDDSDNMRASGETAAPETPAVAVIRTYLESSTPVIRTDLESSAPTNTYPAQTARPVGASVSDNPDSTLDNLAHSDDQASKIGFSKTAGQPLSSDDLTNLPTSSYLYKKEEEKRKRGNSKVTFPDPPSIERVEGAELTTTTVGTSETKGLTCGFAPTNLDIVTPPSRTATTAVEARRATAVVAASGSSVRLPAVVDRAGVITPLDLAVATALVRHTVRTAGVLTVDVETTGYPLGHGEYALRTVQLGGAELALVFDAGDPAHADAVRTLLGEAPALVAHSATADLVPLAAAGLLDADSAWERMRDTVLTAKLADPQSTGSDPGLKQLAAAVLGPASVSPVAEAGRDALFKAARWLKNVSVTTPVERSGWAQSDPTSTTMVRYAASDVLDTAALHRALPAGDPAVLERERAVQRITARITHRGLQLDGDQVGRLLAEHTAARDTHAVRVRALGIDNPGSDAQVGAAAVQAGLVLPLTATGRPSVAAGVLEAHRGVQGRAGELVDAVLAHRHHETAVSTFLAPYTELVRRGDGRARPTIYTLGADTGRMTCVRPNLQQLPRVGGFRACFTADPGHVLISADFASVEIRVMAALSQDQTLMGMLAEGADPHSLIAEQVFGVGWTKADRYTVKRGVFGWAYGGGISTLARQVGVSESVMASVVDVLAGMAPQYVAWADGVKRAVRSGSTRFNAYAGRVIHLDPKRPHAAPNFCIQGSARELLVDALLRWDATRWASSTVLPVHDEILAVVPEADAVEATVALVAAMETELHGVRITAEASAPSFAWQDAS